jgi:ribosomal-protein-alanine N-acetyltransferase
MAAGRVILTTERLTLREMTGDDAPFVLELLNDPSFIRNIGDRGVRTLDDARAYVMKGPVASYGEHHYGLWLVELKQDATPIGMCGLLKRDVLEYPDVGFAYLPGFQSKGYGFEAARAVLDYARDVLCLPRVLAIVNVDNVASARLLEKLGLAFTGLVQPYPDEPSLRLYAVSFEAERLDAPRGGV